ncbi:hypothetical protein KFU94_01195 [Chloroflexi bacterium TSY]|nr:hypothetical protein [Chloroflexi bacterium TSY]
MDRLFNSSTVRCTRLATPTYRTQLTVRNRPSSPLCTTHSILRKKIRLCATHLATRVATSAQQADVNFDDRANSFLPEPTAVVCKQASED